MIVRTVKNRDNPWVQIDVTAANDSRLSFKAIGIHTYIMSKPDGWQARESDMAQKHTDGMASVRAGVKELIECGYMVRVRLVDDQKRVTGWRIDTFETPSANPHYRIGQPVPAHTDEPDCENRNVAATQEVKPHCGFPQMEKPQVENRNHSNKRVLVKIDPSNDPTKEHDEDEGAPAPATATVFKAWQENIPGTLTPILVDRLHDLTAECGPDAVIHGIVASVQAGARNFNYIAKCARNHAAGVEPARQIDPRKGGKYGKHRQNGAGFGAAATATGNNESTGDGEGIEFDADDLRRRLKIARGYSDPPTETPAGRATGL